MRQCSQETSPKRYTETKIGRSAGTEGDRVFTAERTARKTPLCGKETWPLTDPRRPVDLKYNEGGETGGKEGRKMEQVVWAQ